MGWECKGPRGASSQASRSFGVPKVPEVELRDSGFALIDLALGQGVLFIFRSP